MSNMRKITVISVLLLVVLSVAVALEFSPAGNNCLYKESISDHYNFNSGLRYVIIQEGNPYQFLASLTTGDGTDAKYTLLPYQEKDKGNTYVQLKPAITASVFRFVFGKDNQFKIEGNLYGYVNLIFAAYSGTDVIAYDGSYLLGGTIAYKDTVALRVGVRHFSTHLGDEKIVDMYNMPNVTLSGGKTQVTIDGVTYDFIDIVEYVRQNPLTVALSVNIPLSKNISIRAYGEADIPFNGNNTRPFTHTPSDFDCPYYDNVLSLDWQRDKEGISDDQYAKEIAIKDGTGYRELKIHTGLEATFDFGPVATVLSGDIQFHEDGKTKHQINGYDKDNPWEIEYSVALAIQLKKPNKSGGVAIEAKYHNGRFPTPALFYQRTSYISVGVSIF